MPLDDMRASRVLVDRGAKKMRQIRRCATAPDDAAMPRAAFDVYDACANARAIR